MKTIFNTYIEVTSQEQADKLKQICLENDLKIWKDEDSFLLVDTMRFFFFGPFGFAIDSYEYSAPITHDEVTESEWLELLKQHKCTE